MIYLSSAVPPVPAGERGAAVPPTSGSPAPFNLSRSILPVPPRRAGQTRSRPSSDNSPLHRCFEWDNDRAADSYRIDQARKLIGSIVVAQIDDRPVNKEARAFVHIESGSHRYEPIQVAMASVDMRAEVLAKAQQEIKMWRARSGVAWQARR